MNDARGLKPGQSFWGAVLAERGWTAEQAALMLRCAGIAVTDEQLAAWLRPGGDAYEQAQGRAALLRLLELVDGKTSNAPRWFARSEFGEWADMMHPALLFALDVLRDALNAIVVVSPAKGALGRWMGMSTSLHNANFHGMVYAVDVLLPLSFGVDQGFDAARDLRLFSGIGVYPFWKPRAGLHLDVRHLASTNPTKGATPRDPATWGGVPGAGGRQEYVSAAAALDAAASRLSRAAPILSTSRTNHRTSVRSDETSAIAVVAAPASAEKGVE